MTSWSRRPGSTTTYIWWDVRPHPKLGTVEVRGMDVQPTVAANAGLAALIQALAAREIDRPSASDLQREALGSPTTRRPATASRPA